VLGSGQERRAVAVPFELQPTWENRRDLAHGGFHYGLEFVNLSCVCSFTLKAQGVGREGLLSWAIEVRGLGVTTVGRLEERPELLELFPCVHLHFFRSKPAAKSPGVDSRAAHTF
jgi:hypothetical protein